MLHRSSAMASRAFFTRLARRPGVVTGSVAMASALGLHNVQVQTPVAPRSLPLSPGLFLSTAAAEPARAAAALAVSASASPNTPLVTLYQYQPCPFCNKVRAYLDYAGVPYTTVEVDPLRKKEIKFSTDYRKVPIATIDGMESQVNGSNDIIDVIRGMPGAGQPHDAAADTEQAKLETKWRAWVDDTLVHLLTANIYNTWNEAIGTFDYLVTNGNFSTGQRLLSSYTGAIVMYTLSKKTWNKKYNIVEPRTEIYAALDDWITAVGDTKFLGQNDAPTIPDLAIFGVLRAIKDYPTFDDIMARTKIKPWYFRMVDAVGETAQVTA